MLIQSRQSAVEISSAFESTAFTIVDSKNSFALLQGKHYENPSIAVLRALVENALDTQTIFVVRCARTTTQKSLHENIFPHRNCYSLSCYFSRGRLEINVQSL